MEDINRYEGHNLDQCNKQAVEHCVPFHWEAVVLGSSGIGVLGSSWRIGKQWYWEAGNALHSSFRLQFSVFSFGIFNLEFSFHFHFDLISVSRRRYGWRMCSSQSIPPVLSAALGISSLLL
jgi:hypothetical protein